VQQAQRVLQRRHVKPSAMPPAHDRHTQPSAVTLRRCDTHKA
jgi:hypothetical protein